MYSTCTCILHVHDESQDLVTRLPYLLCNTKQLRDCRATHRLFLTSATMISFAIYEYHHGLHLNIIG